MQLSPPLLLALIAAAAAGCVDHEIFRGKPLVSSESYQATVSGNKLLNHAQNLFNFSKIDGSNTRAFGSAGHNATVQYIKSLLDRTGYYDSWIQNLTYLYSDGAATFSANGVEHETAWFTYGPGGDVNAHLVIVNSFGCSQDDFPIDVIQQIALILRGKCSFAEKVARAGAAGAAGALVYNDQDGAIGSVTFDDISHPAGPLVPAGTLTGLDGRTFIAAIRAGDEIIGNLHVTSFSEVRWTSNVVATTKSGDKNNIVFVGGHTDSVPAGPGINDNGSGSMSILELALQLTRFSTKNAVRFGFWTAEEFGMIGAGQYLANLSEEERMKIALYLNFDMVASPNFGYFIYDGDGSAYNLTGPPGSAHIERTFKDYFKLAGLKSAPTEFNDRSDYGPFLDAGIPSGGLYTGAEVLKTEEQAKWWGGQAGVAFDACYHSACDTIDNLHLPAWVQNTKAAAHAIATYATSVQGLPRRFKLSRISRALLPRDRPPGMWTQAVAV